MTVTTAKWTIAEYHQLVATGIEEYWVVNLHASELIVFRDLD